MRQDLVTPVAARARRRDGEPLLEEALSVDGLAVVVDDVVLADLVELRDRRALPVAAAAEVGHVHLVGLGFGVRGL